MAESEIEWTEATWNPVSGCNIVSPGCTNCYAMRLAGRLEAMGMKKYAGSTRTAGGRKVWSGLVRCHEDVLSVPGRWRKPRLIFVNSMSDLFHEGVPDEFIIRLWEVMAKFDHHTYQILTKRTNRMQELCNSTLPTLKNVWLGTSVESKKYLNRLELLRETKAWIRFVSFEPLLGPIKQLSLEKIDWAIVGGESGPAARPINREWIDGIHDECVRSGTAFFFKQWGGSNKKKSGRTLDGRTWDSLPEAITA